MYCTNCGNKLQLNSNFCSKCGNKAKNQNNNEFYDGGYDTPRPYYSPPIEHNPDDLWCLCSKCAISNR